MKEIKIEKGIPMPSWNRGKRGEKYPFSKLKIGESFFMPGKKHVSTGQTSVRTGFKFATRSMDGGLRVWRKA